MKLSKLILTIAIGLFLLVTLESCNEKNTESKQTETVLPKISKEKFENEALLVDQVMETNLLIKVWFQIGYLNYIATQI